MKNSYLKITLIALIIAGMLSSMLYSCAEKSVNNRIARIQQQDLPGLFASEDCLFYGCKYIDSTLKAEDDGGFSGTVIFQRNNQNYTRDLRIYHRENLNTAVIVIENDYAGDPNHLQEDADLLYNMYQANRKDLAQWQFKSAQVADSGIIQYTLQKDEQTRQLKLQITEITTDEGIPVIRCTELR